MSTLATKMRVNSQSALPIDKGGIAYIIMVFEGCGNLFPWNAFITASSYYAQRFCGSAFEGNFENYFSITFTLSQTIGLALSVVYQNKMSLRHKIIWPLFCYSTVFLITTLLVTQTVEANLLFWLTLISAMICGICGAILSGGLFGLAAMFPATYTGALMNGQGIAGLTVAVASILTTLAAAPIDTCSDDNGNDDGCPQEINYSALFYFIIATLILLACAFAYFGLQKLHFTRFYIARSKFGDTVVDNADFTNPLLANEQSHGQFNNVVGSSSIQNADDDDAAYGLKTEVVTGDEDANDDPNVDEGATGVTLTFAQMKSVWLSLCIPSLSVWFVFTVSIGLFPALIVLLESEHKCSSNERFYNDLFVPFFFLLFNLFDLVGRSVAGSTPLVFTAKNVWIGSLSRVVFFPLFMLCNVADSKLPVWFASDAFPILFMILFAFTNGYIASACMMLGPTAVPVKDAAVAGTIMVFSLTFGLFSGSCMSFIVEYITLGHF